MEARAPGRARALLVLLVLCLFKQTAGAFAGSPLGTETYLSTGTEDAAQSTDFPTSSRAVISEGTASFGYTSTSETSELHSSLSEREPHPATDQSSFTEVTESTESWTEQNRSNMSTELPDSSPAFSTNTVSEWEDPIANITDVYTVQEKGQPASEYRTIRDLTVTKLTEKENPDLETPESDSNTDSTYSSTTLSRAGITDVYTVAEKWQPASEYRTIRDLTVTKLTEKENPDLETPESDSNTESTYSSTTLSRVGITDVYTVPEKWQPAAEYRTIRDLTVTKLTEEENTDLETTESDSNTDSTYISTTLSRAGITDVYTVSEKWQPASEYRTIRELTVTKLTEEENTDLETTESDSNTDSTYISTTLSHAGERTLLSITSNSTSPYMEGSSSSETAPHAVTGQVEKTGVTQHMEHTENVFFNASGHSEATVEDFSTNATQKKVSETEVSHGPLVTQSHTGQPTVTGSDFESVPKTSNPSSTPPLTVINSSDSELDTTPDSSTNQSFYTDSSSSSSFVSPFDLPNETDTSVSPQDGEPTETPTGPVSTSRGEKPDEPQTFMEETTTPSQTAAPSTILDITTSEEKSQSTQQTIVSQTTCPSEPTELLSTAAGPSTHKPLTKEDTDEPSTVPVTSTTLATTGTTVPLTTHGFQTSTTGEAHSTPHSTTSATETTQKTTPTTEEHHSTNATATPSLSASSSQSGAGATDLSTLHFETSTATPGSTKAHNQHTTASYNKSTPIMSTAVITTGKRIETEVTTTQMPVKLSLTPGRMCSSQICANGGKCVLTTGVGGYRCECLAGWRGENCTEDVDECVSNPCPQDLECVNTRGSFSCECVLGYDLQDGQSCTQTKTFLGIFSVNGSLHDSDREILQLLNASLSNLPGYRRSTLRYLDRMHIMAVNMFSMSADVTSIDICCRIQAYLRNCSKPQTHCFLKLQHQLTYQMESLCQKHRCDSQHRCAVCNDTDGSPFCQCHEGNFKKNPEDRPCRDCGDGFKLVNGTCIECPFGFGGFNCNNFYGLIAKVVSPAAGGLLIIFIIALIVTCCRKDKNDINKIIFKSGDLQMSPYGEFPKSSRVSMEWGRETIEMQENGSTKNLLQMTDIYYSPALRNADLDRNGLYPFSGLPGSRHSCIYPAQWNPSFICDDSRRRDYF